MTSIIGIKHLIMIAQGYFFSYRWSSRQKKKNENSSSQIECEARQKNILLLEKKEISDILSIGQEFVQLLSIHFVCFLSIIRVQKYFKSTMIANSNDCRQGIRSNRLEKKLSV